MTPAPPSLLEHITTCWPTIHNPVQFVMRYAPAIRKYVGALVRDPNDADDVAQDFLARVFDHGFRPDCATQGRFRDYLKAAVRYTAINHLRRRRPDQASPAQLDALIQPEARAEDAWAAEWRGCLLDRVWQALELHERKTPGNLYFTVLQIYLADVRADSETHAARLGARLGRTIRADAFRQQLHRARRRFAKLLVDEVRQTLHKPTADAVTQELADLELWEYVRETT